MTTEVKSRLSERYPMYQIDVSDLKNTNLVVVVNSRKNWHGILMTPSYRHFPTTEAMMEHICPLVEDYFGRMKGVKK